MSTQPVSIAPVNQKFYFTMDPSTFKSNLTFDLKLLTGPSWIQFDPKSLTFSGTPPSVGTFDVAVQAFTATQTNVDHLVVKSVSYALAAAPQLQVQNEVLIAANKPISLNLLKTPATAFGVRAFANKLQLPNWLKFDALSGLMSGTPPDNTAYVIDVYYSDSDVRLVSSLASSFSFKSNSKEMKFQIQNVNNNSVIPFNSADNIELKYSCDTGPCTLINMPQGIQVSSGMVRIPNSFAGQSIKLVASDGQNISMPILLSFSKDPESIVADNKSHNKSTLLYTLAAVCAILAIISGAYLIRRHIRNKYRKKNAYVDLAATSSSSSMDEKDAIYSMYYDRNSNRGSKVSITSYSTHTAVKGVTVAKLNLQPSLQMSCASFQKPSHQFTPVFTKVIAKNREWTYCPLELDSNSLYNMPQKGMKPDWQIQNIMASGQFSLRTDGNNMVPRWLNFDNNKCIFKGTPDRECDLILRIEYRKNGVFTDDFIFRIIVSHDKKPIPEESLLSPERFMDSIFSTGSRTEPTRQNSLRFSKMNFNDFKKHIAIGKSGSDQV